MRPPKTHTYPCQGGVTLSSQRLSLATHQTRSSRIHAGFLLYLKGQVYLHEAILEAH